MMAKSNLSALTELTEKLPNLIQGWQKSAKGTVYTPDNLFEYINGGAELYISYGFNHLASRTYSKEGLPEIKIDIFDMDGAYNAFGVFAHSKEDIDDFIAPDVESEYASGLLTFWKGRYYVSILAYPETDEKKKIVQKLGQEISANITEKSSKPPLVQMLPKEKLDTDSIRYFRHYIWLNSYFYISTHNILNMDKGTEAVLAQYNLDEKTKPATMLLLVTYLSKEDAIKAAQKFIKEYMPEAKVGFKQLKDKRWHGCSIKGKLIKIIFYAPTKEQAIKILDNVK
jgi:Family of unknown function (DUF6599)